MLYSNLKWFRDEIIHKKNFTLSNDEIKVTISADKQADFFINTNLNSPNLVLSSKQLEYLVKYSKALGRILSEDLKFDFFIDKSFKHHLDALQIIHNKLKFNQDKPRIMNILLKVLQKNGEYQANLGYVRKIAKKVYAEDIDPIFNLTILSKSDDSKWYFPFNNIPPKTILKMTKDNYKSYKIS